jgi:hypothetical protein
MRVPILIALVMLSLAAVGCVNPAQTLRFTEDSAFIAATRATLDLRYHKRSGWSLPEAPGTKEAEDRENWNNIIGGGILFRFHGGLSYREIEASDDVRAGEWAGVGDGTFTGPETVKGMFRVSREKIGAQFGWFTDRYLVGGGLGLFYTGIQVAGSVRSPTVRGSLSNTNRGAGFSLYLEGSPGYPPVKGYITYEAWWAYDGKGFFYGEDTEFGVKGQFRGFELFAAYRMEKFSGRAEHNVYSQSRLKFDVRGPIIGIGVCF